MWETLKPFPLFFGGAQNQPQTRYVCNFNGVSQYGTLNIPVSPGDTVTVIAKVSADDNNDYIFCEESSVTIAFYRNTGYLFGYAGISELRIDGVVSDVVPTDGLYHTYELDISTSGTIGFVGIRYTLTRHINGSIIGIKLNDGSVHNYPMDDGWVNNPTMRNTGTGADGTFINMTEASWVEVSA